MAFQYISDIISKFTQKQRILVLCLLLFSIVLIILGPNILNKFGDDLDVLKTEITQKNTEIDSLNSKIIQLNRSMVDNEQNCTNRLIEREREIMAQLDALEKTLKNTSLNSQQFSYIVSDESNTEEKVSSPLKIINNDLAIGGLKKIKLNIQTHIDTTKN